MISFGARRFRPLLGAISLVFAALGCGDDGTGTPPAEPPSLANCTPGPRTFALGPVCLRDVSVRVRSGGVWRPTGPDESVDTIQNKDVVRFVASSKKGPIEAFSLYAVTDGENMLQQGYQSRSFSGSVRVPSSIPLDEGDVALFDAAATGDPLKEVEGISYGSAVLQNPQGGYLVLGALSADQATTGIGMRRTEEGVAINIVYGAQREPLPADDEGVIASEPLVIIGAKSANAGLSRLASEMAAAQSMDTPPPKRPPGGWSSRGEHFSSIDEALIQNHVALAVDTLAPQGLPLIEVGDGWQRAWGDWVENDKFPSGMEALGAQIKENGLVAGVWMAPFLVDVESEVGKTIDPTLLVRGPDDKPIVHHPAGTQHDCYVLDGTNEASMAIATDVVKKLAAAGYLFFRFDFLYAGAIPGVRGKPGATGNEALRSGLLLLREAAGPGVIINASGAPVLPVLGLADSLQVGADTAREGSSLSFPFITFAARSTAARAFLAPFIWPDGGEAQLREPYSEAEARVSAVTAALAGPAYSLGDDLISLAPARLKAALDPAVLDIAQGPAPAVAEDLFASPAPLLVGDPTADSGASGSGETSAPPPPAWKAVGASGKNYSIVFSWSSPHGVTVTEE